MSKQYEIHQEVSKANYAVGLVLMIGALVLLAYVLYGIYFSEVDTGIVAEVLTPERFTSENGLPFIKDCFDGYEVFVAQYPSHAAMMTATGRSC